MTRRLRANPVKALKSQPLKIADFTDNTDTTGYIDFTTGQLPAGAIVLGCRVDVTEGFAGDTTAVVKVGKSGALADYSAITTASVLTDATRKQFMSPQLTAHVDSATTPRVTVTGTADFTSIVTNDTGEMQVTIFYLDTSAKAI